MRLGAATLLVVAAGFVAACGSIGAIHLTVTTSADGRDADVGDRVCEVTAGAGDCSLRAAIDETNVAPFTTDRITIAPGVDPVLAIEGTNDDANASGDLDVIGNVTIEGGGATIDGARLDRVVDHRGAGLTMEHLTVTGGELSGDGVVEDEVVVEPGNGGVGDGAGIHSIGRLTLIDSTVSDNRILFLGDPSLAARGAGVAASTGPVHIERSRIEHNLIDRGAGGRGGGLAAVGIADLQVTDSVVLENRIGGDDRAFRADGGGVAVEGSTARIGRTSIASNVAVVSDSAGRGAGIFSDGSDLTIVRSTLSGNDGGTDGAPVDEVLSADGSLAIESSTIVSPGPELAIAVSGSSGGGTIRSSVLTAPCSGLVSAGWNAASPSAAVGSMAGCGLTQPTDLVGADLLLGPLAGNGGPSPTHLPGPGSPLIDRLPIGTAAACDGTDLDQRHLPVPRGPGCDVGAVEVQPPVVPPGTTLGLVVDAADDLHDRDPGDGACTTSAGTCTLRAAIDETNRWTSPGDVIVVAAGVDPVVGIVGVDDDANDSGDLDIWGTLAILGCGATVDGARLDRVLDHHAGSLTVDHLTITGGELSGDGPNTKSHPPLVPGNGGVGQGGGVRSRGPLTLQDSTVTDNRLLYSGGTPGAGLDVAGGPVHLTRSTVSDNLMNGPDGEGAGLHAADVADLTIASSVFRGNRIDLQSSGIDAFGGGVAVEGSVATIDRSTFTGNVTSSSDGLGMGGGIFARSSAVTITRSTLSNDRSNDFSVQEIESQGGSLVIDSSTIVNAADNISIEASTATIRSSTTIGRCQGGVVSGGWNVVGPSPIGPAGCGSAQPTDLTVADQGLGPLADNGGPTPTHLPLVGSPLLDRIPLGTPGACAAAATDQRGRAVPVGSGCDVGAVERQPTDPP